MSTTDNLPTSLRIRLASPVDVLAWSSGEVTRPATVDPRSGRPKAHGLFCTRIFGPPLEWRCRCGQLTGERHDHPRCSTCGTRVQQRAGRRPQMGHIELAAPVVHPWFLRDQPSPVALLLGIRPSEAERVVAGEAWLVIRPGTAPVRVGQVLKPEQMSKMIERHGPDFRAWTGARAIQRLLCRLNLHRVAERLRTQLTTIPSPTRRKEAQQRLLVFEWLRRSQTPPEWLVLERLPVVPPHIRPVVRLDSGRFASSELNLLYQRVIRCNNRLREYQALKAPAAVLRDAERLLQRAVEALLDNKRASEPVLGPRDHPLKSLSDFLGGKQGRFRNNLLGKRVDFSARAVIVGGPELQLHQCGLPRNLALRLYEPFVVARLLQEGLAHTGRRAREMLQELACPTLAARTARLIVEALLPSQRAGHSQAQNRFQNRQLLALVHEHLATIRELLLTEGRDGAGAWIHRWLLSRHTHLWGLVEEVVRGHPVLLNRAPTLHRMGIQAFEPVLIEGNAIRLHPLVCKGFNADFDGDQMAVHLPLSLEARTEAAVLLHPARNLFKPANGQPIVSPSQDIVVGCYYLTAGLATNPRTSSGGSASSGVRPAPPPPADFRPPDTRRGEGRAFSSPGEVILAHSLGHLGVHARIRVRLTPPGSGPGRAIQGEQDEPLLSLLPGKLLETTVGRVLFNDLLPPGSTFWNCPMTAGRLGRLLEVCHRQLGTLVTIALVDRLKQAGFREATRSGLSFASDDLPSPEQRDTIRQEAEQRVRVLRRSFENGDLTEAEYGEKLPPIWQGAQNRLAQELLGRLQFDTRGGQPYLNPLFVMLDSRARGDLAQLRQLAGMRGLMASASGRVIERAITSSFREGLPSWDFFLSAHGGRKGLTDKGVRTAEAGYLTRKLVDAAQSMVITEADCGTNQGLLKQGRRKGPCFAVLVRGRVSCQRVIGAREQILIDQGELITWEKARELETLGFSELRVRSPLTCQARRGVCQRCYGNDLSSGHLVEPGTAVGVLAAQSIGEPGTQLTLHTFRLGGGAGQGIVDDLDRVTQILEARGSRRARPGDFDPQAMLQSRGPEFVCHYLLEQVREVYARHGLEIDAQHFEVILARLLGWVEVIEPGESDWLPGEVIDRRRLAEGVHPTRVRPRFLGISQSVWHGEGFLAAASFEKTVQVLTRAALAGRRDELVGLKENVMLGRLIPAGTGLPGLAVGVVRERDR